MKHTLKYLALLLAAVRLYALPIAENAGGIMLEAQWYARTSIVQNDGSVFFIAPNPQAIAYNALLKYSPDGNITTIDNGYMPLPFIGNVDQSILAIAPFGTSREPAAIYAVTQSSGRIAGIKLPTKSKELTISSWTDLPEYTGGQHPLSKIRILAPQNNSFLIADIQSKSQIKATVANNEILEYVTLTDTIPNYSSIRTYATTADGTSWFAFQKDTQDNTVYLTLFQQGATPVKLAPVAEDFSKKLSVACSNDGSLLYFISYLNPDLNNLADNKARLVAATFDITQKSLTSTTIIHENTGGELAVSADGRFAAFNATENENSPSQLFLYDNLQQNNQPTIISETSATDCTAPAISPNGRFATYTAAQNLYLASLPLKLNVQGSLVSVAGNSVSFTLHANHFGDSALLKITRLPEHGELKLANGETSLPQHETVSFTNAASFIYTPETDVFTSVTLNIAVSEDNGATWKDIEIPIQVLATQMLLVSTKSNGQLPEFFQQFPLPYASVSASDDGNTILFKAEAFTKLNDDVNTVNVFKRTFDPITATHIADQNATEPTTTSISPDASTFALQNGEKTLYSCCTDNWPQLAGKILALPPVFNYNATAIAYATYDANDSSKNAVYFQHKNEEPVLIAQNAKIENNATSPLLMSHDANVVLFVNTDKKLIAYFTSSNTSIELNTNVSFVSLSLAGTFAFYIKDNTCYRQAIASDAQPEKLLEDTVSPTAATTSKDGRFLFYAANSTLHRLDIANNTTTEIANSNRITFDTLRTSADGEKVFFMTEVGLDSTDSNAKPDIYRAWIKTNLEAPPTIAEATVLENTDGTTSHTVKLTFSGTTDIFPKLTANTSLNGAKLTLLPPADNQQGYAITYAPKQFFCGTDTVQFQLYNGHAWHDAILIINVQNVNTPPFLTNETNSFTTNVAENNTISYDLNNLIGRNNLVYDEDLTFIETTQESLTWKLPENVPEWAVIENNVLTLNLLGIHDIAQHNAPETVIFNLICHDAAGESLQLPVAVTVVNTSRPPTISSAPISINETQLTSLRNLLHPTDPDAEDIPNLNLHITLQGTTYTFTPDEQLSLPTEGHVNTTTLTAHVTDPSGLKSNETTITLALKQVQLDADVLLNGFTDESTGIHFDGLKRGWNLLAAPYDITQLDDFANAFNMTALWTWDTVTRRFVRPTSLKSDQGFWAYISTVPESLPETILNGTRSFDYTLSRGWNICGPQSFTGNPDNANYGFKDNYYYSLPSDCTIPPMTGLWIYIKSPK